MHQICNFTYYWDVDQLYLREDFIRLLFKLDELNIENRNEHSKILLWYKFISNIIKHRVLKDKLFTTNYIYKNIPSFPAIEKTNYYKKCKLVFIEDRNKYQEKFTELKETTFYKEYLKGIASLPFNKDNTLNNSKFNKDCRKDWLKNDKYSDIKYRHVRDVNEIDKIDLTGKQNKEDKNNSEEYNDNYLWNDDTQYENKFIGNIYAEIEQLYYDDENDFVKTNFKEKNW